MRTLRRLAGTGGWALTDRGRAENERRLAAELGDASGVRRVHDAFLPLNARLRRACTDWQLKPAPGAPLAGNAHDDPEWDLIATLGITRAWRSGPPTTALVITGVDAHPGGLVAAGRRRQVPRAGAGPHDE